MKKFKVYGTYTITIMKEVWANDEDEAIDKASDTWGGLKEYCGNGGIDKLIGVENHDESVAADGCEEWGTYIEELEDDPDHMECPECGEELDIEETSDGTRYWRCADCEKAFDENCNEIYIDEDEEDDDE